MKKPYVLVVEDDEWFSQQQSAILIKAGYRVELAHHALSAIQIIDKKPPDAIILDILLVGSTAFALLHELKTYNDTANIPIIVCSNLAADLSIDEVGPYGVKKILDKSTMQPDDLVAAIKGVLE